MKIHQVVCSGADFTNQDIADEREDGWHPIDISCVMKGADINCCILFEKEVVTVSEEWIPELISKKPWKKH